MNQSAEKEGEKARRIGTTLRALSLLWTVGLLTACGVSTERAAGPLDPAAVPDATPTEEPPSRSGNPPSYEVFGKRYWVMRASAGYRERGLASWYGPKFHGKRTSSGVPYDMHAATAAHKTLPIPTYVRVTRLDNGRSMIVKVNDRGPFVAGRIIDLSYAAAARLDLIGPGTAMVEVEALPPYQYLPGATPSRRTFAQREPSPAPRPRRGEAVEPVRHAPAEPVPTTVFEPSATPSRQVIATAPRPTGPVPSLYLQVGAFARRSSAEQLQNHLAGQLNRVVHIDSSTGGLHRVRLGPLADTAEADRLALQLSVLGVAAPLRISD